MIPGSANTLLLATAAGGGGYEVSRSLRFNSADSAYLSRTPGSAGNRRTWTWAGWVKRSKITSGDYQFIFGAIDSGATAFTALLYSISDDTLSIWDNQAGLPVLRTSQVFRDTSAWFHVVWSVDTTQATASNRMKLYVNGTEVTAWATDARSSITQNLDLAVNRGSWPHSIGSQQPYAGRYFDGYLADVHLIDGTAHDATAFGEFDTNGVWQPKAFSGGSYGTNGFRLDFADNSSAAALGYDAAGSNDWTVNNLSVAAGAGNDSLRDSPTNGSQTDTGVGGEVVGNYATLNPLARGVTALSNGNLQFDYNATYSVPATIGVASGKWYFEALVATQVSSEQVVGVVNSTWSNANLIGGDANGWGIIVQSNANNGQAYHNNSVTSSYATYANGDIAMVAFDVDSGKIWFGRNGTWFNSGAPASGTGQIYSNLAGTIFPAISNRASTGGVLHANFGARSFAYTAPSGFKALCTANLPAPTITNPSTVMDVKLYTGNSSTQTISGLGFSPDFVWLKQRTNPEAHGLFDTVRGAQKSLASDGTGAENATDTNSLTAFTSDGFSLGNTSRFNDNTYAHVAWAWDAGTSNATNTQGTITSTVRANISAGFSIVTWTGTGANATVGHGLGVAPQLVIIKRRSGANDWIVGHTSLGGWANFLYLNLTNAKDTASTIFQSTAPTSSSFSLGTSTYVNGSSETYVAYCFAPVAGYSAFGSYTGNGSAAKDGPFIYTGFRPRWIMIKNITFASDYTSWLIQDTARSPYNVMPDTNILWANKSVGEGFRGNGTLASAYNKIDAVSNGFKIREESTHELNDASATYIYAAFAEHPFALARAR